MRILLSWLSTFVDVNETPGELAATLGMRGFEVAAIDEIRSDAGTDAVIDFEITANRPDCLSHLGMAREVATTYSRRMRQLGGTSSLALAQMDVGQSDAIRVTIDDPDLCPRYGAAVADVTIAPSPPWLAQRLEAAGVRPINNVVDVTNYVLMEIGQPMHAFDHRRLAGAQIRVRRARPGETVRTLDGQDRTLTPDMLVIADADRAQAVAGVMGGAASEVDGSTRTIVLESACFESRSVRATSKKLGLKTEASARFERGTDIDSPLIGLRRACALLEQIGAGRARGPLVDVCPAAKGPRDLKLRRDRIALLLGAAVPDQETERILNGLGFEATPADGGWMVRVPTWRVDVLREADLIEEVGRHYGYDRLPPSYPPARAAAPAPDVRIVRDGLVRRVLTAAGFSEAVCFAFTDAAAMEPFAPGDDWSDVVAIANPLSAKFAVLRRTLLPGLIDSVAHNRRHGRADVALFEVGTRFSSAASETRGLALACTGAAHDVHWSAPPRPFDFFDLKGIVERTCDALGVAVRFEPDTRPYLVPGQTARIVLADEGTAVGELGALRPAIGEARDVPRSDRVYVAELNLDALWYAHLTAERRRAARAAGTGRPPDAFTPLPRYPSIVRDISILVADRLPAESVRGTIAAAAPSALADVREFDRYQGKGVPEGQVSLSLRLTFRSDERTLTDAEVDTSMDAIVSALAREHEAKRR
jgi:phenylalanyl-tRNA synthetase beta chain